MEGMEYELYRIPLKKSLYEGFKFKDICMILFQKFNITLIAIEVRIGAEVKVFCNPSEYVLQPCDHHGYCIAKDKPDFQQINSLNLSKKNTENFFIMDYLNKQEFNNTKKSEFLMNMDISKINAMETGTV
jgi:hypothetical protein